MSADYRIGEKAIISQGQALAGLRVKVVAKSRISGGLTVEVIETHVAWPAYHVGSRICVMPFDLARPGETKTARVPKPCPFDGGRAEVKEEKGRRLPWHVFCPTCGASTAAAGLREVAVHMWNRRTS